MIGLALALFIAVPAVADYVPGSGSHPFWYWSYDTTPIEVFLGGGKREGWPGAQGQTIHLPRAMVIFAAKYEQPEYPHLPDRIESPHIAVELVYPDGAPLSLALAEAARRTGKSEGTLVGSDDFRLRTYSADLFHSEFGVVDEEALSRPSIARESPIPLGTFDGMEVFTHHPTQYYFGDEGDEFYYGRCSGPPRPSYWCSYALRLNEDVHASVSFADLRVNGGRAFINDRVRALRRALCRHMKCEMVSADGSLIRGEGKDS